MIGSAGSAKRPLERVMSKRQMVGVLDRALTLEIVRVTEQAAELVHARVL